MNLERKTIYLKGYVPKEETQICTIGENPRILTVRPFAQLEEDGVPKRSFVEIVENKTLQVVESQEE